MRFSIRKVWFFPRLSAGREQPNDLFPEFLRQEPRDGCAITPASSWRDAVSSDPELLIGAAGRRMPRMPADIRSSARCRSNRARWRGPAKVETRSGPAISMLRSTVASVTTCSKACWGVSNRRNSSCGNGWPRRRETSWTIPDQHNP